MSYDAIALHPWDNGTSNNDHDCNYQMDADCNDAHDKKDGRPLQSVLCASFGRIREFPLNRNFSFSSNDGEFNEDGARHQGASILSRCMPIQT
jgi:hypothetical protein